MSSLLNQSKPRSCLPTTVFVKLPWNSFLLIPDWIITVVSTWNTSEHNLRLAKILYIIV